MSIESNISLINLSKQLPFDIDDTLKTQLCFGETLIISCGHVDGNFSDSDSATSESSESEVVEKTEDMKTKYELHKQPKTSVADQSLQDEDDFQFYFFPDCTKNDEAGSSRTSIVITDGIPQLNLMKHQNQKHCTCEVDNYGHCNCFVKIPCLCGAEETAECTCSKLSQICICDKGMPDPTCSCKQSSVCLCYADGTPRKACTCYQIDRPCVCGAEKYPYPICVCKNKALDSFKNDFSTNSKVDDRYELDETSSKTNKSHCDCQKQDIQSLCSSHEKEKCTECSRKPRECAKENLCLCDSIEPIVNNNAPKHCTCLNMQDCSCDYNSDGLCKCFAIKTECTCGNSENCKCFKICQCTEPCLCDIERRNNVECTCHKTSSDRSENFNKEEGKKLIRVRAGKYGYRWCHDVNPRHTFFGFGYGRHEKIKCTEQKQEKIKIFDAKLKQTQRDLTNAEKPNIPQFKKKAGSPSLDCCSAVGGMTINVETLGEDKGKFLVQVVSHSSKEGAKTGSKLVSIVDIKLHTLEENRSEYIQKDDIFKEKRNYMAICESGYYNKVTRICGDRHLIKRFYHTFEEAHNFLLEGANIVLMRYVGLTRYKGCIKTDTVLIGGVLCENIYVCLGVSHAVVNGRGFLVEKVERHIIEPSGSIHQTLLVLTLKGYVVSQEWANNSYIIHINPLLRVIPERDEIEPHKPLRESWREDLQLLSDYLDFKAVRSSEGARYVSENGELMGTIRDYLQALLLLRPNDALHFTRHYFGAALSALDLPHNEFFDSSTKHVRYYFFEE